jgi:hypothetical protein
MVGYAVRIAGQGMTFQFGIIGAVFSVLGCLAGNLLAVSIIFSQEFSEPFINVVLAMLISPVSTLEIMKETFSPIDLLFYAIAVYNGYRFSIRTLSDEELAFIKKPPVSGDQPPGQENG